MPSKATNYALRIKAMIALMGEPVPFAAAGVITAAPYVGTSTIVTEYMGSSPGTNTIRPIVILVMAPSPLPAVSDTFTLPEYPGRTFTVEYVAAEVIAGVSVVALLIGD